MATDMTEWDFDNLTDDQRDYVRNTGNAELMRRAGLMEPQTFDLSSVPGSIPQHELDQEPMPVFDPDGEVAKESVGEPDDPRDRVLQPRPGPTPEVETTPFEGSTAERVGKEQQQTAEEKARDAGVTPASVKPAAKKAAAPKNSDG